MIKHWGSMCTWCAHTHTHTNTHPHTHPNPERRTHPRTHVQSCIPWAYQAFFNGENRIGDLGNFEQLKKKLQCADFSAYIQRFSYVFIDGGLVPETWHSSVPIWGFP